MEKIVRLLFLYVRKIVGAPNTCQPHAEHIPKVTDLAQNHQVFLQVVFLAWNVSGGLLAG